MNALLNPLPFALAVILTAMVPAIQSSHANMPMPDDPLAIRATGETSEHGDSASTSKKAMRLDARRKGSTSSGQVYMQYSNSNGGGNGSGQ